MCCNSFTQIDDMHDVHKYRKRQITIKGDPNQVSDLYSFYTDPDPDPAFF